MSFFVGVLVDAHPLLRYVANAVADADGMRSDGAMKAAADGAAGDMSDAAADAAEVTIDLLQLLAGLAIGVVAAIAVGVVVVGVGRTITRRHATAKAFAGAMYRPLQVLLLVLGAWIGFSAARDKALAGAHGATLPVWTGYLDHAWGIALIVAATWLVVGIANGVTAVVHERLQDSSQRRAKRVQTQMQILHRVIVVLVWILGFAGVLLTFPQARTAGASLIASAGVVSVVAGLAAQTTLGNVFAGLQLAFSDSIRVGDVVYYNNTTTTVEEITLTYVVLAVWDGRRIIVPSSLLTTQSFENWTRRAPEMVGTVDIDVDWAVPVAAARKQLRVILLSTDLWDGKTGVLQVSNATKGFVQLRAIVSAKNSPTLSDLQNHVREKMTVWIQHEAPQAMPHVRMWERDAMDFLAAEQATLEKVEERLKRAEPVVYPPDSCASSDPHPSGASTQVLSQEYIRRLEQRVAENDTDLEEAEAGLAALAAGEDPAAMRTWQPDLRAGDAVESTIVMKRDDVDQLVRAHARNMAAAQQKESSEKRDSQGAGASADSAAGAVRDVGAERDTSAAENLGAADGVRDAGATEEVRGAENDLETAGARNTGNVSGAEDLSVDGERNTSNMDVINKTGKEVSESALFSGSAEAEERQRAFAGPGEEAYEERKKRLERSNGVLQKVEDASDEGASGERVIAEQTQVPTERVPDKQAPTERMSTGVVGVGDTGDAVKRAKDEEKSDE
ncbi:MAG: mechanosensitive ion channel [Actinomycetaceae bacterium]|nr:mechanosensitive ion channel [Actinomycetaceae bacterium]MDY5854869.1 mechanosensitive ion channel [Arcanobacterium sp.]